MAEIIIELKRDIGDTVDEEIKSQSEAANNRLTPGGVNRALDCCEESTAKRPVMTKRTAGYFRRWSRSVLAVKRSKKIATIATKIKNSKLPGLGMRNIPDTAKYVPCKPRCIQYITF